MTVCYLSSFKPGALAGAAAALPSGVPSTAWALATGRDPLEATLAAGSLLLRRETRRVPLVLAAVPVHLALSVGWGAVLAHALPRPTAARGAVAGLAIAALDLGLVARHHPRVRALPLLPQLADHLVYGAIVGAPLREGREGRPARPAPPSDP
ncbi:MAG TPA: hypothetical protein VK874_08390 [Gaiellaceae bacterium]|nr:hypothetical protein [Gaiellaceae bacterium]